MKNNSDQVKVKSHSKYLRFQIILEFHCKLPLSYNSYHYYISDKKDNLSVMKYKSKKFWCLSVHNTITYWVVYSTLLIA